MPLKSLYKFQQKCNRFLKVIEISNELPKDINNKFFLFLMSNNISLIPLFFYKLSMEKINEPRQNFKNFCSKWYNRYF